MTHQPTELTQVWPQIQDAPMFVVKTDDGLFYVESPDDQGLTIHDTQETLIRLFLSEPDAAVYKGIINEYLGIKPEKLGIVPVSMKQMFEAYPKINNDSKRGYGCPIRVELCSCKQDEFPEVIDTLITNTAIHH